MTKVHTIIYCNSHYLWFTILLHIFLNFKLVNKILLLSSYHLQPTWIKTENWIILCLYLDTLFNGANETDLDQGETTVIYINNSCNFFLTCIRLSIIHTMHGANMHYCIAAGWPSLANTTPKFQILHPSVILWSSTMISMFWLT